MPDNQIEPTNNETVLYQTPSMLMQLAVQKDFDIERLKALMELQERWEKNEAIKAYVKAMTEFKKNPPKIYKDMLVEYKTTSGVTKYNHASLGNVVATLTEELAKYGFSSRWTMEQNEGRIKVVNIITHELGHSESVPFEAPPDQSGGKNSIQAIGSTQTYLERYTFLANVGLATNEFEDDGRQGNIGNGKTQTANSEALNQVKSAALDLIEQLHTDKKLTPAKYKEWKTWVEKANKIQTIQDQIDTVLKPKLEKDVTNA